MAFPMSPDLRHTGFDTLSLPHPLVLSAGCVWEQEDAKEAFCSLLRDKKIGSESSWEQAMRNIAGDAR